MPMSMREMGEKTLRWPGHAHAVRPLVAAGLLIDELRRQCVSEPAQDLVALVVRMRWGKRTAQMTMVDRYDSAAALTAMARTTALTTATVARLAAEGGLRDPGVRPLELVARDEASHRFVVDEMARRGVSVARNG